MEKISPCFFGVTQQPGVYQVSFEITNRCNLKCKHCCNDSSAEAGGGLSKQEIFDLVDDLKGINATSIYLTGGEPTVFPDFVEVIGYIRSRNIDLVMATNGFDLAKHIDAIRHNVSHQAGVFVSLDGIGQTHDEIRGVEGTFDRAVNSIRLLVKNGIPARISTVVWGKNISQLEDLITLAKSLGVYQIHFSTIFNTGRTAKNQIGLGRSQYRQVVKKIHALIKRYTTEDFIVSTRRDRVLDGKSDRCRGGDKILHINSRGQIFPCSWSEKCSLGRTYGAQWRKGNIRSCVAKVERFQKLVEERTSRLGYSGCPAMAAEYYKDEYADDPINELLG